MGLQLSGSVQLEGNLLVTGSANSVFENISVTNRITANEINVQFVSSSIIYSSGSNRFGDEAGDVHQFTGSLQVSGSSHNILGNVGIGLTETPSAELQVGKSSDVTIAMSNSSSVTTGARGSLAWYNSSVSTVAIIRAAAVTDNVGTELQFYTRPVAGSLTQTMTLDASGRLGINTNSTRGVLDISSGLRTGTLSGLFVGADADTTTGTRTNNTRKLGMIASPHYNNASSSVFGIAMDNQISNNFIYIGGGYSGYNAATAIVFSTGLTTTTETGTEAMRITPSGSVGIGTNNPTNGKLEVQTSTSASALWVQTGGTTSDYVIADFRTGTNAPAFRTLGNGNSIFGGNVGIGVVPNTWTGTNVKALQIYLGSLSTSLTWGTALAHNAYYDGSWRYTGTFNAGKYDIGGDEHIWYSAPSGTAGDTISFVETMKLTTDGYLGVGKNSTAVLNGDLIGLLAFKSNDVSSNSAGAIASIRSYATADYNTGNVEGDMRFYVSNGSAPNGSFLSGNEAGRFTKDRFFKAGPGSFENAAGAPHEFTSDINDSKVVTFRHSGNSTPYGLQINFTSAAPNDATRWIISAGDSSALRFKVNSNGGIANYQSNNVDLSDERVKTDILPIGSSWNEVKEYEIVSYKYIDQTHDDLNIGVIAQQIELVNPNLIDSGNWESGSGEPLKTVYNKDLYFTAIKALQEAMIRIEQLETKVAQLQNN